MKRIYILVILLSSISYSQWNVSASMGLDFKSVSSFKDYINTNFSRGGEQIASFKSAVSFTSEFDYFFSNSFASGIEYSIQLDSYNTNYGLAGIYEISYTVHRPSLAVYYVIPGEGYQFKFGGGGGYRYAALKEKNISSNDYTASGFGLVAKAEGNTKLAKNFYALIGGNVRYDNLGDVANGSQKIINPSTNEALNLNSISFGIYLGVTLIF